MAEPTPPPGAQWDKGMIRDAATADVFVRDTFTTGEVLASQAGANGVLTFTLNRQEDLLWILSKGGVSFADPFGGTPANGTGIYLDDGVPQPVTLRFLAGSTFKVWAPSGATVYAWAYGS